MTTTRRLMIVLLILITVVGISGVATGVLTDMAGHWSAPLISALEARGIVSGNALGQYDPEAPLTRAQMAKLLVVSLGTEADANLLSQYASRFRDMPAGHWAKGYVESLAEAAVTEGYPDGTFHPNEVVTRAQMAVFLVRAAGLANQQGLAGVNTVKFADDSEIPDWAHGSIYMAASVGLLTGYSDGNFRPGEPIRRAEGGTAVLRMAEFRGAAYHLAGTLVKFDSITRQGTVRNASGQERAFTMAESAQYFRSGIAVGIQGVRRYDQVWIVLGPDGIGRFLEGRYGDLAGTDLKVDGQKLTLIATNGVSRRLEAQPGTLFFLNGRPAIASQVSGATHVYVLADAVTGEARVVDAVKAALEVPLLGVDVAGGTLVYLVDGDVQASRLAPEALIFLNGQATDVDQLAPEDRALLALNDSGQIVYVQAER